MADTEGLSVGLTRRLLEEAGIVAPAWPYCLGLGQRELAEALHARYREGATMSDIADATGITRRTVRDLLESVGADLRTVPEMSMAAEEMVDAYLRGASLRAIASQARTSYTTVRETLRRAGIPLRTRGKPPVSQPPD